MRNLQVVRVATPTWKLISKQAASYLLQVQEGELSYTLTTGGQVPSEASPGTTLTPLLINTVTGDVWVRGAGRVMVGEFVNSAEASLFTSLYVTLQHVFLFTQEQGGGAVASVNGQTGEVMLTYADIDAEQVGTAGTLMTNHLETLDPHGSQAYTDSLINDTIVPAFSSALAAKADTDSPVFGGSPQTPTGLAGDNSLLVANTAFVQQELAAAQTGVWKDQGNFSAAGGAWPTSANTLLNDAPKAGYLWKISTGGTLTGGVVLNTGDIIRALVDNPTNSANDWAANESNLGYVPENQANKVTNLTTPNNTTFPTTQAVADALGGFASLTALRFTINPQTNTSYPIAASDVTPNGGVIVTCTNSGAISVTIGTPADLGKVTGDSVSIRQGGTGLVTITGSGGATLVGNGAFSAQYETKTLVASSSTSWLVVGG